MDAGQERPEHQCAWGCRGGTHVDLVSVLAAQGDDETLRTLREEYAARGWRVIDVAPTSRVPATIGGRPVEVIFRAATQP